MGDKMKIYNAVYRINTVDMRDLLENKNEVGLAISNYLTDIKTANIPANAPANLPRIVGQTKDKMINVVMTNNSVEFSAINAEEANDQVIFNTIMESVDKIGSFFENYSEAPFNFCGFSISTKFSHEDISENAIDYLNSKISNIDSDLILDNAMIRKCFIQGNYFINITIRNEKQIKVSAPKQNAKPTSFEIADEFIVVELDVNDKHGFLQNPSYFSEIEQALVLSEDVCNFYNNKFLNFVKTGNFDFFK